jgi:hypothetical protein
VLSQNGVGPFARVKIRVRSNQPKFNKMKKVETYLPVFPGFYSTIFEPQEDNEISYYTEMRKDSGLTPVKFEQFVFDYESYQNDIAEACCSFLAEELKGFVSKISLQYITSPKEYNFSNDSFNVVIDLSKDNLLNINP